jgi:hypothetical protein
LLNGITLLYTGLLEFKHQDTSDYLKLSVIATETAVMEKTLEQKGSSCHLKTYSNDVDVTFMG